MATNNRNIPQPFAAAIHANDFSPPDNRAMTVRSIIDAPQVYALKKKHGVTMDTSEMIWALIQNSITLIIKKSSPTHGTIDAASHLYKHVKRTKTIAMSTGDQQQVEELNKLMSSIQAYVDHHLSGKERWVINQMVSADVSVEFPSSDGQRIVSDTRKIFDYVQLYDKEEKILYVIKTCPVSYYTKPYTRTSWEREANAQAYLLEKSGLTVTGITAVMIFRDWAKWAKDKSASYPPTQMEFVPLILRTVDEQEAFLKKRVVQHVAAQGGVDVPCSDIDRWKNKDTYAVVRGTGTKVKGGFHTVEDAADYQIQKPTNVGLGSNIVPERGECRRCVNNYCGVADYCPQWKKEKELLSQQVK